VTEYTLQVAADGSGALVTRNGTPFLDVPRGGSAGWLQTGDGAYTLDDPPAGGNAAPGFREELQRILPAEQQRIVELLHGFHGELACTFEEAAKACGCTRDRARGRYGHARDRLRAAGITLPVLTREAGAW
jgi:hypothetical protein